MRGTDSQQAHMFSYVSPERRVPADHPLRPIRAMVDAAFRAAVAPVRSLALAYTGRPSVPPEEAAARPVAAGIYYTRRRPEARPTPSRWTPLWPLLPPPPSRWTPPHWPVLRRPSRWTPLWPLLPRAPSGPAPGLPHRRRADTGWRSRDARRSPLQCVAAANPAAPTRSLVLASLCSRRCSSDAGDPGPRRRVNVPIRSPPLAAFQLSINGRFWASTEGCSQSGYPATQSDDLPTSSAPSPRSGTGTSSTRRRTWRWP